MFDLRGNTGGSSIWGDQMAAAVFGETWLQQTRSWLYDGVFTEWRVSRDNLERTREGVASIERRHGTESEQARNERALLRDMEAALKRGDALLVEQHGRRARRGVPKPRPAAVPGKVVLLTSDCFSSCLIFLDVMRIHPAVEQVGWPSDADTEYLEIFLKPLPSGLARLHYPTMIYRNRRRGTNEAYEPHVLYDRQLGDTATVRKWLLDRYLGSPPPKTR